MSEPFKRTFHARWGDMDFNAHMRNTAFLDAAADARMMYFELHGFTMRDFERLRIGPAILRDEAEYYRELRLLQRFDVNVKLAGSSVDGSKWRMLNEFTREDGLRVARVTSVGVWLDLDARKARIPPAELAALFAAIERADPFEEMSSGVRPPKIEAPTGNEDVKT